jgi:hypothetical protein
MTDTSIRPIETKYKGCLFRSRTEARWAVFFDAARIEWQYEVQGFDINGTRYLPDFWLPRLKCFAEVKPDKESATQAESLLRALSAGSSYPAILLIERPGEQPLMPWMMKEDTRNWVSWRQCIFCGRVGLSNLPCPGCPDDFEVVHVSDRSDARIEHAIEQARSARFEWGETGEPPPFIRPASRAERHVYVAGSAVVDKIEIVDDDDGKPQEIEVQVEAPWRAEILGARGLNVGDTINFGFFYGGPTFVDNHGCIVDGLAVDCIREVGDSDFIFAWIDAPNTIGTIAEIAAAYAYDKPIFVAFATGDLAEQFYFAKQLATVAIIVDTPTMAWKLFQQWHRNRA